MPHNPKNYKVVPAPLEPQILEGLMAACESYNIPRNKLIRMCVKYGLANLSQVIASGDKKPKSK